MPHIHEKIDFTASVFIVQGDAVLLRMHEKFNKWLQPGGHVELDEDPTEAALREAKEETGLTVTLVGVAPHVMPPNEYDRDLLVPRFMNRHSFGPLKPGHEHVDFIYFGTCAARDTGAARARATTKSQLRCAGSPARKYRTHRSTSIPRPGSTPRQRSTSLHRAPKPVYCLLHEVVQRTVFLVYEPLLRRGFF